MPSLSSLFHPSYALSLQRYSESTLTSKFWTVDMCLKVATAPSSPHFPPFSTAEGFRRGRFDRPFLSSVRRPPGWCELQLPSIPLRKQSSPPFFPFFFNGASNGTGSGLFLSQGLMRPHASVVTDSSTRRFPEGAYKLHIFPFVLPLRSLQSLAQWKRNPPLHFSFPFLECGGFQSRRLMRPAFG